MFRDARTFLLTFRQALHWAWLMARLEFLSAHIAPKAGGFALLWAFWREDSREAVNRAALDAKCIIFIAAMQRNGLPDPPPGPRRTGLPEQHRHGPRRVGAFVGRRRSAIHRALAGALKPGMSLEEKIAALKRVAANPQAFIARHARRCLRLPFYGFVAQPQDEAAPPAALAPPAVARTPAPDTS